jgi:hypothetical protein
MPDDDLSARAFGPAFKRFLEQSVTGMPVEDSPLDLRVRDHVGADPSTLETVSRSFRLTDRPNVQVGLDAYLAGEGRSAEAFGFVSRHSSIRGTSLSELVARSRPALFGSAVVQIGPVTSVRVELDDGRSMTCIDAALLLLTTEHGPWRCSSRATRASSRTGGSACR